MNKKEEVIKVPKRTYDIYAPGNDSCKPAKYWIKEKICEIILPNGINKIERIKIESDVIYLFSNSSNRWGEDEEDTK